jgi:LacI family transcriptional regulator
VLAAIADLGFVRNESARQLRSGTSRTLAYLVLGTGPFFTDVARGVEEAAAAAGRALFLCSSGNDQHREDSYLDVLEQHRVEAILITSVGGSAERLAQVRDRGTPVVVVAQDGGPGSCSVTTDDVAGGELAVAHLLEAGHRRIALIGGPRFERVTSAHHALVRAGAPEPTLLSTAAGTIAEGRQAGERLVGIPVAHRPTAAFCANDLLAIGLLQSCVRLGVAVPDDLAIVGYDDIEFAAGAAVPLTSVVQPRALLGRTAAELAIEEAEGRADHEHRQVVYTPELAVRASTRSAAPAGR